MSKIIWTLEEGLRVTRIAERAVRTCDAWCAIGGGVMYRGESTKDLDIIIAPLTRGKSSIEQCRDALRAAGFELELSAEQCFKNSDNYTCNTPDRKIDRMTFEGKRVDVFWFDWSTQYAP